MHINTATQTACESAVTIAPFCLARVGGVSAQPLDGLALTQTAQHLHAAFAAENAMLTLAPTIEDELYKLVPQTEGERELRRCVLRVKRNVHNLRHWPEAAADLQLLSAVLSDSTQKQLAEWRQFALVRETAMAQAVATYPQEVAAAGVALAQGMRDTELQAGIAVASPSTLTELLRALANNRGEDWKPTSKIARSSLAYYTRAALKPSPLSTFTQLTVATFDSGVRSAECGIKTMQSIRNANSALRNVVRLLRALPFSWLQLVARDREFAPFIVFEPNGGLYRREAGKLRVLSVEHTWQDAFALRTERIATRQFNPAHMPELAAFLAANQRATYQELIAKLTATGRFADPHRVLTQLLDVQFIRPVAPYSQSERGKESLQKLADLVTQAGSERGQKIAALLGEVARLTEQCHVLDGAMRMQLFAQLRQTAAQVFEVLGSPVPDWLQRGGLIYEDVRYAGAPILLNANIRRDLADLAATLRPGIIRCHLADFLYGHFVRRFGTEGKAEDILGFLQDFVEREDFREILSRAMTEDRLALQAPGTSPRTQMSAGQSAVAPSVSVYYQIAAESEDALQRGDYQLIVNEIHNGQGGLVGRFTDLLDAEHGDLAERMREWVNTIHADVPVLEVPVMSEWTNLHSRLGVTGHALQWPGEAPTTEPQGSSTYQLRDLRLCADATNQALYFTDRDGRPVSLTYLGLVPGIRFQGPLGLLLLLIEPWYSNHQVGKSTMSLASAQASPVSVEFTPRQQRGRVVLQRARWRFPVAEIPVRSKGETEFDFFVRVQQWRAVHNLPEEVFAVTERAEMGFDARYRKPIWVHLNSPHTLELLRQIMAQDAIAITLTEALPTRQQHWVAAPSTAGKDTRVCELVSLMGWPMPTAAPATKAARAPMKPLAHRQEEWLYYKIYPAKFDQLDEVIRQVIGPARDLAQTDKRLKRWFFLRFVDQQGPHIRLRMHGSGEFCAALQHPLEALMARTLPQLESSHRTPLLPFEGGDFTVSNRPPFYVQAAYEPEYEKYGGPVGVTIAETFFEVSSELALKAVSLSDADWVQLGLRMMKALVRTIHPAVEEQTRFLKNYLWYWSGQDRPNAVELRQRLALWARQRSAEVLSGASDRKSALDVMLKEYRQAINTTIRTLTAAKVPVPVTRLCFDYLHVNNNRLGIAPPEEGWLAALLLTGTQS